MPKSKVRRRTSTRSPDENGRCRYCGRWTSTRARTYEPTTYVPTDQPEAPAGARWAHSIKASNPPPLCFEAEKGRRAQEATRWTP